MNGYRSALGKGGRQPKAAPLLPDKKPSGANEVSGLTSVPVTRETVRSADHRSEERLQLASEPATLTVGRNQHQVELVNLSGGGAMIRTDAALAMWQEAHLGFGDCLPVQCTVRWIRGDRIGLEFAPETGVGGDRDERNAMLLEALERSFPEASARPVAVTPAGVASPAGDRRRDEVRHLLIWWGEICCNNETTPVRLRNISAGGALVESDSAFPGDAEVVLDLGEAGRHFAIVTWSRGDQVGLRFEAPFDIALLARVKPEVASPQVARPKGGGSGPKDLRGWTVTQLRDELEAILKR